MTIDNKHPRGRPRGSGKDDMPYLMRVADLIARDASLKPTAAMKRVMRSRTDWQETEETLLRRWQVKWKADGESLMVASRARNRPQHYSVPARRPESPWTGMITRSAFENSLVQVVRDMENSPMMRAMKDMRNSSMTQAIKDMASSPAMRAMKDMRNSSMAQAIKDMENSPTMRAIEGHAELVDDAGDQGYGELADDAGNQGYEAMVAGLI